MLYNGSGDVRAIEITADRCRVLVVRLVEVPPEVWRRIVDPLKSLPGGCHGDLQTGAPQLVCISAVALLQFERHVVELEDGQVLLVGLSVTPSLVEHDQRRPTRARVLKQKWLVILGEYLQTLGPAVLERRPRGIVLQDYDVPPASIGQQGSDCWEHVMPADVHFVFQAGALCPDRLQALTTVQASADLHRGGVACQATSKEALNQMRQVVVVGEGVPDKSHGQGNIRVSLAGLDICEGRAPTGRHTDSREPQNRYNEDHRPHEYSRATAADPIEATRANLPRAAIHRCHLQE
mmetsp:Transcript_54365/g.175770  ORF Transcript_54365/g.175770 Transcript_54365/m.175770 type:complete len:293 (-) Transcript_54365:47-925(-)